MFREELVIKKPSPARTLNIWNSTTNSASPGSKQLQAAEMGRKKINKTANPTHHFSK